METITLLDPLLATKPAEAPVPVAAAPGTAVAKIDLKALAISRFGDWRPEAARLVAKYKGVAFDLSTTKGMDAAKAARAEVRAPRYAAQNVATDSKKELAAVSKAVGAELDAITKALADVEKEIDDQITAEETRKAEEKRKREEAETARKVAHAAALEKISSYVQMAVGKPIEKMQAGIAYVLSIDVSAAVFEEFAPEAERRKAATLEALGTMLSRAQEAKAERDRIEAQRIENERIAEAQRLREAEIAEMQRKLDEQAAELQRRQDEIVAAQRAADEARKQAEAPAEPPPTETITKVHIAGNGVRFIRPEPAPTVTVGDTQAIVADAKTGEIHTIDGEALVPADAPQVATPDGDCRPVVATGPAAEPDDWLQAQQHEKDDKAKTSMDSLANVEAMHSALWRWRWAEHNNDAKALEEARAQRDEVLDRVLPF